MPRGASEQKRSQWRERFRRFAQSELSVTEFCQKEHVSTPSFYHWRKKLDASPSSKPTSRSPPRASFIPVQVAMTGDLQVNFPNGVQLTLPVSDPELVRISIDAIAQARTRQGDV